MYYTKLEDLPENADDFFSVPAISKWTGKDDLKKRLAELRLAFQKYKDRRPRIEAMAHVLKVGIKTMEAKKYKRPPQKNGTRKFEDTKKDDELAKTASDIFLKEDTPKKSEPEPEKKPQKLF